MIEKTSGARSPLVVLTEFGLEMGSDEQIIEAIDPLIKAQLWMIPLRLAKVIIESPSAMSENRILLTKIFARLAEKYFLGAHGDYHLIVRSFVDKPPADIDLMQIILFCLSTMWAFTLTNQKTLFKLENESIIDQYLNDTYKTNGILLKECNAEVARLRDQAPISLALANEIPDPTLLFTLVDALIINPPLYEAVRLVMEGGFLGPVLEWFLPTREFMSVKDWDLFLMSNIETISRFCSDVLKIYNADSDDLTPKKIRLTFT